jgi:hypothetical protein
MTEEKLESILDDCCNDIYFIYNGKNGGVTPEVHNYKRTYHAWYGEKIVDYTSLDELLEAALFDGKKLLELVGDIDIEVS